MLRKPLLLLPLLLIPLMVLAVTCSAEPPPEGATSTAPQSQSSAPAAEAPAAAQTQAPASSESPVASQAQPPASGQAPAAAASSPDQRLSVVTTSNIIADWVQAVGQDRVHVFPLLPANADPHTYQPGARDITRVADADLVLSIGLSLEAGWLQDVVENAAKDPEAIVALGNAVDPIDFVELIEDHDEEEVELLGRLLIGDGETGAMSLIDLEHGEVSQDQFDLGHRAGRIYASKNGRFAIAVSSDANTAHLFDGGVFLDSHGDHFDLVEAPAQQIGIDLTGDRPVHLYVGGEWATIFYDGSGDVVLINEHELEEQGAAYVPVRFNVGPQHGAAVPLEGDLVATSIKDPNYPADPDARRPIGAEIRDLSGNVLYRAEAGCPNLHGDAANGHMAVFGCTGGALAVEAHDGEYSEVFISAPAGAPEDFRLTSVWGYPGMDHFYALGSAEGLYIVEPEEGSMEQLIPATEELRPIQVAISHDGETLLVVMSDGELRMYETHDPELLAATSEALTTPVETDFWARPHLATAPGAVFVTDSVGGMVLQLDDHDLEVVESWEVAGTPVKVAFVGVLGETGGHEEAGHGDDGGDGHGHGALDPHFWFDPQRVEQAINSIAAQLSTADPAGQTFYRDNAAAYTRELQDLDAWIQQQVDTLPEDRRLLVTSHDSFQYFAKRYGFEIVGAVMPVTADVEPTAQELTELIETIEHEGVPAVFAEKSHSDRLARRVAEETGATLIGGLYTGSLGEPGSEAGTYLDFMRYNVQTIVEALQ